MKKVNTKKLATASILCAVAVVGSLFSFPVFGSKCAPVQHMVNIICAVLLGPAYGVGAAFVASLIRNLLGLGSLMASPEACSAHCCAVLSMKKPETLRQRLSARCSERRSSAACALTPWRYTLWGSRPRPSRFTHTSSRFSYQRQAARRYPQS